MNTFPASESYESYAIIERLMRSATIGLIVTQHYEIVVIT